MKKSGLKTSAFELLKLAEGIALKDGEMNQEVIISIINKSKKDAWEFEIVMKK